MCSPLRNSLENQTKTIKEQIEKQIKTNEKSNALTKKYYHISKNGNPDILKKIDIFNKLVDESKDEIFKFSKDVDYDNLAFN